MKSVHNLFVAVPDCKSGGINPRRFKSDPLHSGMARSIARYGGSFELVSHASRVRVKRTLR